MKKALLTILFFSISSASFANDIKNNKNNVIPLNSVCKDDIKGKKTCMRVNSNTKQESIKEVYKYIDKNGNTHYSSLAPKDGPFKTINNTTKNIPFSVIYTK